MKNAKIGATPGKSTGKEELANNFRNMARTTATEAADAIINAIQKKTKRLLIGADAHVIDIMKRIAPEAMTNLVGYMAKKMG